jgi:hypothetical protein
MIFGRGVTKEYKGQLRPQPRYKIGLRSSTIITMRNRTSWKVLCHSANCENWASLPRSRKESEYQCLQSRSPRTAGGHVSRWWQFPTSSAYYS